MTLELENSEIDDLSVMYKAMTEEGKKRLVIVAGTLLTAQKILKNEYDEAISNSVPVTCSEFKKQ